MSLQSASASINGKSNRQSHIHILAMSGRQLLDWTGTVIVPRQLQEFQYHQCALIRMIVMPRYQTRIAPEQEGSDFEVVLTAQIFAQVLLKNIHTLLHTTVHLQSIPSSHVLIRT